MLRFLKKKEHASSSNNTSSDSHSNSSSSSNSGSHSGSHSHSESKRNSHSHSGSNPHHNSNSDSSSNSNPKTVAFAINSNSNSSIGSAGSNYEHLVPNSSLPISIYSTTKSGSSSSGSPTVSQTSSSPSTEYYTKMAQMAHINIQAKAPNEWSVTDVSAWLASIDLSEYIQLFSFHSIGGSELLDLSDSDLVSLPMDKIGHRRKIIQKVNELKKRLRGDLNDDNSSEVSSHSTHVSEFSHTQSVYSAYSKEPDEVIVKCFLEDDIRIIKVMKTVTYPTLVEKIEQEYGQTLAIKYKDEEGDLVSLSQSGLPYLLQHADTIRLYLSSKSASASMREDSSILENFNDGVVIIDKSGTIVFFNKAAEEMFGYQRHEVISHNVRRLMNPEIAKQHNHYIRKYLRTGKSSVLGLGRKVQARKKNGEYFDAWLSVSENKTNSHKHTFTATIQPLGENSTVDLSENEFLKAVSMLDDLLTMAIVFSDAGVIQYINKKTIQELALTSESTVGKRKLVSVLSALAFEESSLFTDGGEKLDGFKRDIVVDTIHGAMVYTLSIAKTNLRHKKFFTAMLSPVPTQAPTKSLLQEEREVISALAVPGIIVDERGIVQEINKAAQELLGYTANQILARNVAVLIGNPEVAKQHNDYIKKYLETKESEIIGKTRDTLAMTRDGSYLPIKLSVTAKERQGRTLFTGILQPIN